VTQSAHVSRLTRRDFIAKVGGVVAGGVVASNLINQGVALAYADETPNAGQGGQAAQTGDSDGVKVFDGVGLSQGRVVHNRDLCAGCRQCEIACSLNKWGVVDPDLALIRIRTDILGGYISQAEVCKQCAGPECVAVCPNKANHIDPDTGARVIDLDLCVGCQLCLNACPLVPSRVHYHEQANVCVKCDLCGGDPVCIQHCPTGALTASWVEADVGAYVVNTSTGVVVNVSLTGAIIHLAADDIQVSDIDTAVTAGGIALSGSVSSTYSQPFTAKIKAAYFDEGMQSLFFSERLEVHVESGDTVPFEAPCLRHRNQRRSRVSTWRSCAARLPADADKIGECNAGSIWIFREDTQGRSFRRELWHHSHCRLPASMGRR
jgi:Fe-S-cluster-containing dehydrogenase component